MRWLAAAAVVAGCYAPSPASGLPCAVNGDCPGGQSCDLDRRLCSPPPVDAAEDIADVSPDVAGSAWAPPQPLTEVNSSDYETDPALSPDGLELFFSSDRPGGAGMLDIYRSTRASTADAFGAPVPVFELETTNDDLAVEVAPDGLVIYFRRGNEIYRATRSTRNTPFTSVTRDSQLSTPYVDTNPTVSGDSLLASTTRELSATDRDIVTFQRSTPTDGWGPPRVATEVNTAGIESASELDEHGLAMLFHSDRPGGLGSTDIWLASRPSTSALWSAPVPVTELNTPGIESDPSADATWRILVIERERDIYITTR